MAKEKKKKEKVETGEKKEKPLILVVIVMLVLLLGLVAFLAYSILTKGDNKTATGSSEIVVHEEKKELPENTYSFEKEFLVNLSDTEQRKFLKISVSLGYTSKKLTAELGGAAKEGGEGGGSEKLPAVRDAINSVLRSKKSTDFTNEKGIEDVKKEVMARINPLLKNGRISEIYFNEIFIQ